MSIGGKRKLAFSNNTEGNYDCYRCGKGFFDKKQLQSHEATCQVKSRTASNTMSYTQSEISRSVCDDKNPLLPQNAHLGEAYQTQLLHKLSMATLANQLRNDDGERQDSFEGPDVDFDPMEDDRSDSNSSDERDDQETLPLHYRNKMKRYEEYRNKKPDKPGAQLPEQFAYVGENVMSSRATAYAELLKICSKHNASRAMYEDIANWAQHWSQKKPDILKAHSKAQRLTRKKMLKHLKEVFPFQGLDSDNFVVELHDGRTVSVPVVDFADSMRSILTS